MRFRSIIKLLATVSQMIIHTVCTGCFKKIELAISFQILWTTILNRKWKIIFFRFRLFSHYTLFCIFQKKTKFVLFLKIFSWKLIRMCNLQRLQSQNRTKVFLIFGSKLFINPRTHSQPNLFVTSCITMSLDWAGQNIQSI